MTPSSTLSAPVGRRYRFSILRVLLCGVLMAVLVAACLYLYRTAFTFYHARMLDNQSKTFAWFVEQTGFSLPFIVVCIFQYAVYHKHDRRDGVAAQEMFWEILLLSALVYGVLYPYVNAISDAFYTNALAAGESITQNAGKVDVTLIMELHEWFIRLSLPILVLLIFHSSRARRERLYPNTETVEPVITKDEYHAMKAAAAAQDAMAAEADDGAYAEADDGAEAHESTSEGGNTHE